MGAVRLHASTVALAILGLAFFLREHRLADKNIWWDEGWTVWLSRHDLAWIALRTASDEHPPLHYWLMHFWNGALGTQAFVGRFVSVFFGVLTVALLYRLAKKIGGVNLGLLAALLLALARFHVWWSQDIKNYTLSGFFALASVWFVLGIVARNYPPVSPLDKGGGRGVWLGYVVSITLALYSHYLAALIFLANNLFVAMFLIREWRAGNAFRSFLVKWSAAQFAVIALFAPWLALYLQNGASWTAAPAFDFALFLRLVATVFALGVTTYIENYTAVVALFTLLAIIGAAWLVQSRATIKVAPTRNLRNGALLALVSVLVPPILIYTLSLTPAALFAPKIQARYLLILLPAYSLLLALGILWLARFSKYFAMGALVLITAAQVFTLNDYFQERVLHDEYFTLAQVINSFALPGDGVVLNSDQEWPTFLYYLKPSLEWVGVPNANKVDATLAHRVAAQAEQYRAVWVVTIPDALEKDPQRLVETELARSLPKQYEQIFGNNRLALYASDVRNVKDVPRENFSPQYARTDIFDNSLMLVGLDLPVREAQSGDSVRVVTYWQSGDLASVRLALGGVDGQTIAEQVIPISIGAHERAEADFVIPPDARASEVRVVAQARLVSREVGSIHILPRESAASGAVATSTLNYRFGSSILLNGEDLPQREFRAGEAVPLTLFWRTEQPLAASYIVFVHLLGAQYNPAQNNFLWGQVDRIPLQARLPTSAWAVGQAVADAYSIPIQPNAPTGTYKIEIGMYDAATGARLRVFDANGKDSGDSLIVNEIEIK